MRTFIAIELPPAARAQVQRRQEQVRARLAAQGLADVFRWTPVEQMHLTLRFLGETTSAQQAQLAARLAAVVAGYGPFGLTVSGVGCFPRWQAPRVLWLGIQGASQALGALQAEVEQAAQEVGFVPEERPFSPHLTIARLQRQADRPAQRRAGEILAALAARGEPPGIPWPVQEIVHMRSDLRPGGPIYTVLETFRLQAP